MPSFAPREQPSKKLQELSKREVELINAINKNLSFEQQAKAAEKYRKAQISLVKAKSHVAMEEIYRKRLNKLEFDDKKKDIIDWENKTIDQIICEFIILKKIEKPGQ